MAFSRLKSALVILLSVFAIFQTVELWLGDFSSRNFFYNVRHSFLKQEGGSRTNSLETLLKPKRLIANMGENRFGVIYDYIEESPSKLYCDNALSLVLNKGTYVSTNTLDWQAVLRNRSILYEYSIPIPTTLLANYFGQKSNLLTSKARQINMMAIIPSRTKSEQITMLFIDEENQQVHEYVAEDTDLNGNLFKGIQEIQSQFSSFFYVSTALSGFETFEKNIFVPRWVDNFYPYNAVTYINPYSENGDEPLLYTVEKKIDTFFDNPAMKDAKRINGIYTYSGDTVLVRYKQSSVLEYFNYRPISKAGQVDLASSFAAVNNFLKKDNTVLNTIYLAEAKNNGNQWIFYFDYVINNLPIYMSDMQKQETGLTHALEIIVENNEVLQYKRYVAAFEINEDVMVNAYTDFLTAIDNIIDTENFYENSTAYISNIELAYRIEKDKASVWHWFLTINGNDYLGNAQ